MNTSTERKLCVGAKAISRFIYGDEKHERVIYESQGDLPIFRLNGQVCAYEDTLAEAVAQREAAAIALCRQRLDAWSRKEAARLARLASGASHSKRG